MPNNVTPAFVTTPPTVVVPPRAAERPDARNLRERGLQGFELVRPHLGLVSAVAASAWWLLVAARWWGGRDPGAVTGGAILTALAVLATRPQCYLPAQVIALAAAISAAAFGVALTAPTGWAGAATAASYVCVAWTAVVVAAAVVRDPRAAQILVMLVVAGVLVEMSEAWLTWWGGSNAAAPILGTFYWYDPFAAFLLSGSVLGLSLWLQRDRVIALLGLVGCVLGSIGLVYSTSRAALACLLVAFAVVALTHVVSRGLAGLRRLVVGLGVTALGVFVIAGPPFFPHRVSPFAGTAARGTGQSLSQNGAYRVEFWHEALGVLHRHLLVGGGYHSLAKESAGHVPSSWALSPLAHSGYLQALSDGGLLLGVPFLLAVAGLVWLIARAFVRSLRTRDFAAGSFVVPVCLAAMLAHSAVDFDWSYPADFAVVAILAGLVIAPWASARRDAAPADGSPSPLRLRAVTALVLLGVALVGVAAQAAWSGDIRQSSPITQAANPGGAQ